MPQAKPNISAAAKRSALQWNRRYTVGQSVTYCKDNGDLLHTRTRQPADVLGGHTAVIWVDGMAGCVLLDRVTAIRPDKTGGAA